MPAVWAAVKHRLCVQLSHFNSWALLCLRAASEVSQGKKISSQVLPVKAIQNLTKGTPVDLAVMGWIWPLGYPGHAAITLLHLIWQGCECYRVPFFSLPPFSLPSPQKSMFQNFPQNHLATVWMFPFCFQLGLHMLQNGAITKSHTAIGLGPLPWLYTNF